jgi:dUTP pyrophosphatase
MYPRSSLSKTPLRLANSTGIIDSGYRGNLMAMFDVINLPDNLSDSREADYFGRKLDRYVQICAPGLVPIIVEIVNSIEDLGNETIRGGGGFGSTGR